MAGAKAAQLGELAAIGGGVAVPRGFVIPFAAYLAHGQRSGATVLRDVMLADAAARSDPDRRAEQLRLLRERIARSSLTNGAAVLSEAELLRLAGALRAIHERFVPDPWDHAHAMDVEFILRGPRRELMVVQARPYTLRYDQGRETAVEP